MKKYVREATVWLIVVSVLAIVFCAVEAVIIAVVCNHIGEWPPIGASLIARTIIANYLLAALLTLVNTR